MRVIATFVTSALLVGCSFDEVSTERKFFNNNWEEGDSIVFEGGQMHMPKSFDTLFSDESTWPSQIIPIGDTLIDFEILDSAIVYGYPILTAQGDSNKLESKFISDTLMFEFREFDGPKLIIESPTWHFYNDLPYYRILSLQEGKSLEGFMEIRNFDTINFSIGSLRIGDTINREDFVFRDVSTHYYPFEYTYEEATLLSDPDISVEISNRKYISLIERKHIPSRHVSDIKNVVSHKLGQDPSYRERDSKKKYHERYSWYQDGIHIELIDKRHFYNTIGKLWGLPEDGWVLTYENEVYTQLVNFSKKDKTPQSLIIE
jgi:hypothetical protein